MAAPRLGVDVGGTFTDVVLAADETLEVAKVASTPDDQAEGVVAGLERLDVDAGVLRRFAHGTTVATNAVLERRGARTVLVVSDGFRDLLEIARQDRPSLYDLGADRPPPLVPRELVVEASERVAADGEVLVALDDPEAVAGAVRALDPEAVAVCLLFSFLHDRHERAIERALDGVPVSRSSDVLPVFREYERASTTCLNAYVAPQLGRYLASLADRLADLGLRCGIEVMRSSGGTCAADLAARYPVHTLLSGPAGGAWGAAAVGRVAGSPDLIAFDMGGTSTDVTLIEGGRPATTSEGSIDRLPFAVVTTDVHTVGAGGGSIGWRDAGGSLRVGPRSAGAHPGPAAYGRGGTEPTVTDAHLLLGRLDERASLGGTLALQVGPAREAVARLAAELGLDPLDAAAGVVRVVEASIARALRVVSVQRGRDPRDHALLAFGGAGPLHQGPLARELGCPLVIVPPHAGVLAAIGLLTAPVAVDLVRTSLATTDEVDPARLDRGWAELEAEARELLAGQDVGVERLVRTADCRYRGQAYELPVDAPDPDPAALARAFHAAHRERYGYDQPDEAVELVNLRVRGEGPEPSLPLRPVGAGPGVEKARLGSRPVLVDGEEHDCAVYDRALLGEADRLRGPAVVAAVDTTCLLLPGQVAEVDDLGNLLVREG